MTKYTINFASLALAGDTRVVVGRQQFDQERLAELRSDFHETHVFWRESNTDSIIDVPVVADQKPIGNVEEEIELREWRRLWPILLSAALVRAFKGVRDILSDRPVIVLGSPSLGLVRHPELPHWMERRTLLRFDTRTIYSGSRRSDGIVCEARVRNLIHGTCADLFERGLSPVGKYVQVEEPHYDTRIMDRRRLVGRVKSVGNDKLLLEDHAEGFESVSPETAFVEARRETFDEYIHQLLGESAGPVLGEAEDKAAALHAGPGRKEQIEKALGYLRDKVELEPVPGARFVIGKLMSSGDKDFPETENIPKPILVFDPSGTRKDNWNERGLKINGPYDQRTFSPKQLRIAVICQARHEGRVDSFIAKFLDGMPDVLTGRNRVARYGDGLLRRFALEKPNVTYFTAPTAQTADYAAASRRAMEQAANEEFKWDLALVQVEEDFKTLDNESNPYYATKSIFLKRDVPVQSVRLETMGQADNELVFSMNHMSLATYAKLGGTPWLLASSQTVAHELVIGLGSHSVTKSRIGSQQRFVGITTVFSSDGRYLLSDRTAVVPFEEYAGALYDTLKRAITTVRRQDNWRSTDKVRLVFHMFKPPKDTEAEAIKKTVDDLELENVTFAFVHIAASHPYLIFDNSQEGIGYANPKKGVLGPSRGLHVKLGDRESLVVFSGASELKQASDGMPRPCLLRLHRLSTFTDMTYLARQAFEFAGHSWRTLAPEPFPITIRYSDLIAERLSGLSAIPGWDPEAVRFGQIGRTLWFL